MEDSDFKCSMHESNVKVEDGVSFNWAYRARKKIPNAYLHFQERAVSGRMKGVESGRVDFYLNGFADTAIEVMLDATQTAHPGSAGQSQDIDKHLERFTSGKYPWKRYVLFNFAMKGDTPILPRDTSAHDKVYTYVRSTNTLYRGDKRLKSPAIPKLSGGSRSFSSTKSSAILRAGATLNTKPAQFSVLRPFMTCICLTRWL